MENNQLIELYYLKTIEYMLINFEYFFQENLHFLILKDQSLMYNIIFIYYLNITSTEFSKVNK